jgi:hypothetical protein
MALPHLNARRHPVARMSTTKDEEPPTPCPKCRSDMVDVVVTPHPLIPRMRRHTFVCYTCNQTRTYMLPAD